MLALAGQSVGGSSTSAGRLGLALGQVESDLLNLAHEADPSSSY